MVVNANANVNEDVVLGFRTFMLLVFCFFLSVSGGGGG